MIADITSETLTVTANSRNSRPMMPLMNRSGMNTAISENVIDTIVKAISREPASAASRGVMPASTWRATFSTITIASSITKPTAIVSAISDRLFRL